MPAPVKPIAIRVSGIEFAGTTTDNLTSTDPSLLIVTMTPTAGRLHAALREKTEVEILCGQMKFTGTARAVEVKELNSWTTGIALDVWIRDAIMIGSV